MGLAWVLVLAAAASGLVPARVSQDRMCRQATVGETDRVRAELAAKEAAYEQSRRAAAAASVAGASVPSLAELEFVSLMDAQGGVSECGATKSTRASVYAIFDENRELAHVGKSRDAQESLRQIVARQPERSYFFKVFHVERPSRAFLDVVADSWIDGRAIDGNDGADGQRAWESPFDVSGLHDS